MKYYKRKDYNKCRNIKKISRFLVKKSTNNKKLAKIPNKNPNIMLKANKKSIKTLKRFKNIMKISSKEFKLSRFEWQLNKLPNKAKS